MAKGQLNESFERVAKAMEKRLAAEGQKQIKAVENVGKRARDEVGRAFQSGLNSAVANVEKLADELRISNAKERETLRRALETVQGGLTGAQKAASFAALAPDPRLKAAILVAAAAIGAAEGASLEEGRKAMQAAQRDLEREQVRLRALISSIDRDVERLQSARRRSGKVG